MSDAKSLNYKDSLALPALMCLVGVFAVFHPTLLSAFAKVQGDLGDTRFNLYILEHSYKWLLRYPNHLSFWDLPIFYPAQGVGAYSDLLIGTAPFYWVWRLVGLIPETAFQLWLITLVSLNYIAGYWFLRKFLKLEVMSASFGAYLFAFGSSRVVKLYHQQLLAHFYLIAAIYFLSRLFQKQGNHEKRNSPLYLALFLLFCFLQFCSGFYNIWFFALLTCIFFAWALFFKQSRDLLVSIAKTNLTWNLLIIAVFAILFLPIVFRYLGAASATGYRPYWYVNTMLLTFRDWLNLGPSNWIYGWTAQLPFFDEIQNDHEKWVGLGLVTSIFCLYGLWLNKHKLFVKLLFLSFLSIFILSYRISSDFSLWRLVYEIFPGAAAIRAAGRVGIFMLIPASLGLAFCIEALYCKNAKQSTGYKFKVLFVALFVLAEQFHTTTNFDKSIAYRTANNIAIKLEEYKPPCKAFVLSHIKGRYPEWKYQLDAMRAHLQADIPTLNGYAGNSPPTWQLGDNVIANKTEEREFASKVIAWLKNHEVPADQVCWVRRYGHKLEQITVRPCCEVTMPKKKPKRIRKARKSNDVRTKNRDKSIDLSK